MNLENIKLVISDMDGTLLRSNHEISPEFESIHQKLIAKGIQFVPASGRQFHSITNYFKNPDQMAIIAENGTFVSVNGKEVFIDKLDWNIVKEIIIESRKVKGANVVLAGKNAAYVESKDQTFLTFFKNFYLKNIQVEDLLSVKDEQIIKIAIHHAEGSEKKLLPIFKKFEQHNLQVVVSGEVWIDIMNHNINKGIALKELQKFLNVSEEETMVFGDYMNDIEMLKLAKYSFAMENAHPNVKKVAKYSTNSNDEDGVIEILKKLL